MMRLSDVFNKVGGVISAMSPWKPARKESPAEVPEETASIKPPVEESTTLGKRKEAPKKETPKAAKEKKPAAAQKLKLDEEQKEPAPTVVEVVVEEKKPEEKKPKAPQPKKAKAAPAKKAAAPKTPVGTGKKPAKRKTVTEQLLENMFDGEAATYKQVKDTAGVGARRTRRTASKA